MIENRTRQRETRKIVFETILPFLPAGTLASAFNVGLVHAQGVETVYIHSDLGDG